MARYRDKWTGDEVMIECLENRPGTEALAVIKGAGGARTVITQDHMNDRYEIVTPQTIELQGNAELGSGAH